MVGATVLTDDYRRDPLADSCLRIELEETAIVMAVRIDEPWRENEAGCVDDPFTRASGQLAEFGDPVGDDSNRCPARGCAGAVHDPGIDDQGGGRLLCRRSGCRRSGRRNEDE